MPSAPDEGAEWGPAKEAEFLAWQAAQGVLNDASNFEDEECFFTPQIKNVKGVSSHMGDFGQAWKEKRLLSVNTSRAEQLLFECQELSFQPDSELTKATNEELLEGSGYQGPVQGWRKHAARYARCRGQGTKSSETGPLQKGLKGGAFGSSLRNEGAAERTQGQKVSRQKSWGAVVQRLYPYNKDQTDASMDMQPPAANASAASQEKVAEAVRKEAGGNASAGAAAVGSRAQHGPGGPIDASPENQADLSIVRSGKQQQRRCGRPPKATWQYLYESGTRSLRGKSVPTQAANQETPHPLKKSEKLLQDASTRRRLWSPKRAEALATPAKAIGSTAAPQTKGGEPRSLSVGFSSASVGQICQRLHDQHDRQRSRQEQRMLLANEVKMAEEMRECTFRPQTNSTRNAFQGDGGSSSSKATGSPVDENSLSLYERGVRQRARRQQLAEEGAQERAEAELSACTFRPVLHRHGRNTFQEDSQLQISVSSSYVAAEADQDWVSGLRQEPSFSSVGMTVEPQQDPQAAVLMMLDDWRGRKLISGMSPSAFRSPDDWRGSGNPASARFQDDQLVQALPFSPPARASTAEVRQEPPWQEPSSSGAHLAAVHSDLPEMHSQRHAVGASDVQVLLQDWRGGWGCGGDGTASGPTAVPPPPVQAQQEWQVPQQDCPAEPDLDTAPTSLMSPALLSSPMRLVNKAEAMSSSAGSLAPTASPSPPVMSASEANIVAMLQHWRATQNGRLP